MTQEIRAVEFGIHEAHYAEFLPDGTGYGLPKPMIGAKGYSFTAAVVDKVVKADDQVHVIIPGEPTSEGTLTFVQLIESFQQHALGMELQTNGVRAFTGERNPFAFMFKGWKKEATGPKTEVIYVAYNLLTSPKPITKTSVEGEVTEDTYELSTIFNTTPLAVTESGKLTPYVEIPQNVTTQGFFDNYGTEIYLPATPVPVGTSIQRGAKDES